LIAAAVGRRVNCIQPLLHVVVVVYTAAIVWIVPHVSLAGRVGRRPFQTLTVDVDDIATVRLVVSKRVPWQRMITVPDSQESTKAHNRIFGFAGALMLTGAACAPFGFCYWGMVCVGLGYWIHINRTALEAKAEAGRQDEIVASLRSGRSAPGAGPAYGPAVRSYCGRKLRI
jgi:hypothetical protein